MIHENVKEIRRNSSDLGLGVRFKSCVTVQAPAQFGTHKNDSFQVFRIRNMNSYDADFIPWFPLRMIVWA